MSLKVHSHLDYRLEKFGAVSKKQGKRFHQEERKKLKTGTKEDGTQT